MHRRVLAIAMALSLAACGGTGSVPSGPVDSPLPAGTYTSTGFGPAVTFTLPDGWVLAADSARYLQLRPAGQDTVGIHLFRDAAAASQDPACPVEPEPGIGTTSTELVAWMRGLEGLVASSPTMVTVGGLRGSSLDLGIAATRTQSCPFANGLPAVSLIVEPGIGLRWVMAGGERLRLYILDLPDGGTVIVDIDDYTGAQIDSFIGAASPVVKSLEFATE